MAGTLDIILGVPGAGKTEQASRLAASHRYIHLSTGKLLRNTNDPKLQQVITSGGLASSEQTEAVLLPRLKDTPDELPILLDGFPRDKDEAKWLESQLTDLDRSLGHVFYLEVPKEEALARLAKRGRDDDNQTALNERWKQFHKHTEPVIKHLKKQLVIIDGTGTPEAVAARIAAAL